MGKECIVQNAKCLYADPDAKLLHAESFDESLQKRAHDSL